MIGIALAASGLAVATAAFGVSEEQLTVDALQPLTERHDEIDAYWDAAGETGTALREAVARTGRAVVRARVVTVLAVDRGATTTYSSGGSGFVVADGDVLVLSAHQVRRAAEHAPGRTRVEFAMPDGRGLVATLLESGEDAGEDWATCRIHDPFDLQLDALDVTDHVPLGTLAALGYPEHDSPDGLVQVGWSAHAGRAVVAVAPSGAGWPAAEPLVAIALGRVDRPEHGFELLLSPPHMEGMSGGPVVDSGGHVVAITSGSRFDFGALQNADGGTRMEVGVRFLCTPTRTVAAAVERARRARTRTERRIDALCAVVHGLYDRATTPAEFGLPPEDIALLGFGASLRERGPLVQRERRGETEFVTTVSTFQTARWYEAKLRELAAEGPSALESFRRELDRTLLDESLPSVSPGDLDELLAACRQIDARVHADSLELLGSSPNSDYRVRYAVYLASITCEPTRALRLAFALAAEDTDPTVHAAADEAVRDLLSSRARDAAPEIARAPRDAATSPEAATRLDAACVLGRSDGADVEAQLSALAQDDPDDLVRAAAQHFLDARR